RTVGFAPDANSLTFAAQPRGGLVPLTTGFLLDGDLAGITRYDADLDGDGAYETSSATLPALARTYTTPGIRIATVRITRADGRTQVASAIVNPQSVATLDGLFQSLWQRFTSALAARDVEGALAQMLDAFTREKYRRGLTRIQPLLPSYAASVRSFRPKELEADYAHYLLIRAHSDGQEFGYHVYFQRDEHGVWKLVQF
ncbi:MAG TPA: hypothetical protein VF698_20565, partial [Thermoanaerobaculia bacterium]